MNASTLFIQSVLRQQAFRQVLDLDVVRHQIVVMLEEEGKDAGYTVGTVTCPAGNDGLPWFPEGVFMGMQRGVATLDAATTYFDDLVRSTALRSKRIGADETIELTAAALSGAGEAQPATPLYYFAFDSRTPGRAAAHLDRCLQSPLVSAFFNAVTRKADTGGLSFPTRFMPIVVSLAIAGIGELRRESVPLTEGQLRTIGRHAEANSDELCSLYNTLGLRESLPDFGAQIGERAALTL